MASNRADIEEELMFQDILISTLDPEDEEYATRHASLLTEKQRLEDLLEKLNANGTPPSGNQPDLLNPWPSHQFSTYDKGDIDINGMADRDLPEDEGGSQYNRVSGKRSLPEAFYAHSNHDAKRPTPDRSFSNTPSFASFDKSSDINRNRRLMDQAHLRQLQAVAALTRRSEIEAQDAEFAKRLDATINEVTESGNSQMRASVQYPGASTQTTLGLDGSYNRPLPQPQPKSMAASEPTSVLTHRTLPQSWSQSPVKTIKSEARAGPSTTNTNPVRPTQMPPAMIDLTGDSSDGSEDLDRGERPELIRALELFSQDYPNPNGSANSMPGSYPMGLPPSPSCKLPTQEPGSWGSGMITNAKNAVINVANNFLDYTKSAPGPSNVYHRNAIGTRMDPYDLDGDEWGDPMFIAGLSGFEDRNFYRNPTYRGYDDLYNDRYDEIAHNDPAKTREEINALLENIRPDEDLPEHLRVQTPEALTVRLHKYQEVGLSWLQNCETGSNKGGILADDMGLGKTVQMLSLLATHRSDDPRRRTTLVVAPVALMRQWKQEIHEKIKPGHRLTVCVHHGPGKKKHFRDFQHYDIVLTTFGSLAVEAKKMEVLALRKKQDPRAQPGPKDYMPLLGEDSKWYRCVLDEAQCIRNRNTQTARGAYMVNATYRFCMTGTPMMNNLGELYSLIKFLRIPPYCVWEKFRLDFIAPMKSAIDERREAGMRKLQTLCKAIMLRRTKKSTFEGRPILILPERTTQETNPVFSQDERNFYEAIENKTRLEFNKYFKRGTVGKNYTMILVILLRLRQACCHPHLIKDFGVAAAADVSPEQILEYAKQLDSAVVARIKESGGNFECPVCYDATPNPAIFLPCGHDTCAECLAQIADPENAMRNGDENTPVRCPKCRANIDPKHVTDFNSFKRIHMPELLTAEELALAQDDDGTDDDEDDEEEEGDDDDSDSDDGVDEKGNLKDFIVDDDAEPEIDTESEAEEVKNEDASYSERSTKPRVKREKKKNGKTKDRKKGKGKAKDKSVTIAELKKLATRNAASKKKYLRMLRRNWITSAKIEKTMEHLHKIMAEPDGEKVLIFSQWTSLLDLLEVPIDSEGWGYRRYDGSMNTKMRGDAVDDFRSTRKNIRIMLVSLKAGNAGLNLNMASQVIILDPFWNPFIEEQAIDRAHRIGQTRPVQVHRMLIPNTVEDRIVTLQEQKRALIGEALDEAASKNIARLGVQELAYLFGITRNPNETVQYTARH